MRGAGKHAVSRVHGEQYEAGFSCGQALSESSHLDGDLGLFHV
jgi:hypothetical protein